MTAFTITGRCPLVVNCVVPTSARRPAPVIVEAITQAISTAFENIHSSEYTVDEMTYQADSVYRADLPAGSRHYILHYTATITFANPACATYFALKQVLA